MKLTQMATWTVPALIGMTAFSQIPPNDRQFTDVQWRSDLKYLATELESRHANLYHAIKRDAFQASVEQLDRDIPKLTDREIFVRLSAVVSSVRDGHTGVNAGHHHREPASAAALS
jgi:hypothetical protein